jgi:protein phosphatase
VVAGHNNIEHAGLTDVGARRSHNQDSYALLTATNKEQWLGRGHIFLVADGMGAHAVGELASKMAADSIPHIYSKYAQEGPVAALRRAFIEANTNIHTRGQQNREFEGMGTTSTALLLRPEGAWVGHVGDSRIYRIRDNHLEQMTFDHSLVWEMARRQKCSPEELKGIPPNVIVRSLGPEPLVQIDIEGPHTVQPGDVFVLCSDGLSGPLSDQEIGAVATMLPPAEACKLLIDLANLHGGPDNITAIIVRVFEVDRPAAESGSWISTLFQSGPAWHEKFPWPLISLVLGILLALVAILLTINNMSGNVVAFLFAAIALMIGLAGVMFQFRRHALKKEDDHQPLPPPKMYRKVSCAVTRPLVDKLVKAQAMLRERIQVNDWPVEWEVFERHQQQADEFLNKDRLNDAFRETCRALAVLTDAIQRNRNKTEVFQPLWERRSAQ